MKQSLVAAILVLVLALSSVKEGQCQDGSIPYFLQDYAELYRQSPRKASLAWFEKARMGMFIHWGVWGKYHAAWAMYNQVIPLEQYHKDAREVNASGWDARKLVMLAEQSGMHYITFVVKHHDGFCLWNTRATDWNSMKYAMHRDFLAELSSVCRQRGMPLYIYYSIGIDWVHPYFIPTELYAMARPHYPQLPGYFQYRKPQDFERYRDFCKQQLTELCTRYGPVAGFWFDTLGGVLANSEMFRMQEFYDLIHHYQPHALIHFKTGATGTEDILVGERELKSISMHYVRDTPQERQIRKLSDEAWNRNFARKAEIAVTSQGSWEWDPKNPCQDVEGLWKMLVVAAANNANLLLNVGPMPDGSIPKDVEANFRCLGQRIAERGYPEPDTVNYLRLRREGSAVDQTERQKTAR